MSSGTNFIDTLAAKLQEIPHEYRSLSQEDLAQLNHQQAHGLTTLVSGSCREISAVDQGTELSIAERLTLERVKHTGAFVTSHYVALSWVANDEIIDMFLVDLEEGQLIQAAPGERAQLDIDEREDVRNQILKGLAVAAKS